jgi:hypothetical protein
MIAAYYRFEHDPRGQMPLFPEGISYEQYLEREWRAYYQREVTVLAGEDAIARMIVTAVAYENSERGYAAEDRLKYLLDQRYGDLQMLAAQRAAQVFGAG